MTDGSYSLSVGQTISPFAGLVIKASRSLIPRGYCSVTVADYREISSFRVVFSGPITELPANNDGDTLWLHADDYAELTEGLRDVGGRQ